ncbi:MAG TPA: DUF2269 family protein [Acidimicrobiales bacterium]
MDSGLYKALLVAHIIAAIVGVGAIFMNVLFMKDAMDREVGPGFAVLQASLRVTMVAEKLVYLILVSGLAMVWASDGDIAFSDAWVWLSIVTFVAWMACSHGVLIPTQRAMVREMRLAAEKDRAPDAAMLKGRERRARAVTPVMHTLLAVLVVLMVWKPGA